MEKAAIQIVAELLKLKDTPYFLELKELLKNHGIEIHTAKEIYAAYEAGFEDGQKSSQTSL